MGDERHARTMRDAGSASEREAMATRRRTARLAARADCLVRHQTNLDKTALDGC